MKEAVYWITFWCKLLNSMQTVATTPSIGLESAWKVDFMTNVKSSWEGLDVWCAELRSSIQAQR